MNPTTPMTSSAGEPWVASSIRPMIAGQDVEHRRERRHLAQRHEAVLDDPRAAAELGRRDVGVVGALDGIEDVVGDVEPELDERRADDRQRPRPRRSNDPWRAAIRMPSDDRHDRRGQERQAGRAQGQEPERQLRLDRRPALGRQRIEVPARLAGATAPSIRRTGPRPRPSPRRCGRQGDRRRRRRPVARPQTVTWRRSS